MRPQGEPVPSFTAIYLAFGVMTLCKLKGSEQCQGRDGAALLQSKPPFHSCGSYFDWHEYGLLDL